MGWNEVDNKHKKHTDKAFVACDEKYEIDYLKRVVKEEFPRLSDSQIENAFKHCCVSVPAPRPRDKFIACLKQQLGGV